MTKMTDEIENLQKQVDANIAVIKVILETLRFLLKAARADESTLGLIDKAIFHYGIETGKERGND